MTYSLLPKVEVKSFSSAYLNSSDTASHSLLYQGTQFWGHRAHAYSCLPPFLSLLLSPVSWFVLLLQSPLNVVNLTAQSWTPSSPESSK